MNTLEIIQLVYGEREWPVKKLADLCAVVQLAAQAERHRIYAALEADPGALWRDQGFQEWRNKKQLETNNG